jgi:hypothetical protein
MTEWSPTAATRIISMVFGFILGVSGPNHASERGADSDPRP